MQKIAVGDAIGAAFAFVFLQPLRLLRLGGPWLPVMLALIATRQTWLGLSGPQGLPMGSTSVVFAFVAIGGLFAFGAAVHRAVLVGETRPWLVALRFGKREWRFVGYGLLIAASMRLPYLLVERAALPMVMRALHPPPGCDRPPPGCDMLLKLDWLSAMDTASSAIDIPLRLIVWIYGSQLVLVFAGIAVDEVGGRVARAWQRSRGNRLRLYVGSLACLLPFIAADRGMQLLLHPSWDVHVQRTAIGMGSTLTRGSPLYDTIAFLIFLLGFAVLVAFYSYCYRQLTSPASSTISPAPEPAPA